MRGHPNEGSKAARRRMASEKAGRPLSEGAETWLGARDRAEERFRLSTETPWRGVRPCTLLFPANNPSPSLLLLVLLESFPSIPARQTLSRFKNPTDLMLGYWLSRQLSAIVYLMRQLPKATLEADGEV